MSFDINQPKPLQCSTTKRVIRPRSRRRRRGLSMVRRCSVTLAYFCFAYGIVSNAVPAYLQAHRLEGSVAQVRLQISAADQKHTVLETKVQELKTTEGEQNAARPYGWLLKGERAIACPHPEDVLSRTSDGQLLAIAPERAPSAIERLKKAVEW